MSKAKPILGLVFGSLVGVIISEGVESTMHMRIEDRMKALLWIRTWKFLGAGKGARAAVPAVFWL